MNLQTFQAITEGFKNYTFKIPEMEKLAVERAKICAACPHANPEYPFKLLKEDGETEPIQGMGCNICGCLLSAKIRQMISGCPEKKW